jgi:hypothetical protein
VQRAADCVIRAVSIAADRPYRVVHDDLDGGPGHNQDVNGVPEQVERKYLQFLGWKWHSMAIPPMTGRVVVVLTNPADARQHAIGVAIGTKRPNNHVAAVIDGTRSRHV